MGRFRDAEKAAREYDRAAYYLLGPDTAFNFTVEEAAADVSMPSAALVNLLVKYSKYLAVSVPR